MTTALDPDPDPLSLGVQLLHEHRAREALPHLLTAVSQAPNRADAWFAVGAAQLGCGALRKAEAALRQALRLAPEWADAWSELGRALAMRGVRDEPLACWRRSLELAPDHVEARSRLASALLGRGDLDEAETHLTIALSYKPHHAGSVAAAIALLERRGRDDEAWDVASHTPVRDARVAVAAASVGRRTGHAADALVLVDRALGLPGDRTQLLHARADLLDALDRTDEAFAAWADANLRRRLSFDPAQHQAAVQRVIDRTTGRAWPAAPVTGAERAALIVGVPRTGSTVLERALSRHPAIAAGGEIEALRDLALAVPGEGEADWVDALDRLTDADAAALGARYLAALAAVSPSALRVTDKMPDNLVHLGLLARILPGARVIRCARDPLDTAWSCFRQPLAAGLPWATSLEGIATWLGEAERLLDHWAATLPLRFHTVRYEDLVARPDEVLRGVCAFLELPFDLAAPPLHARSVGRSRRYERFLRPHFPS